MTFRRVHFIQCPACGAWIDMRDLGLALQHAGKLPHGPASNANSALLRPALSFSRMQKRAWRTAAAALWKNR
jgi:hypothetical protein